ncbi:hypothetical protein BDY17DRAFT_132547 [Neohortaea acidophila]|uniref:Transmembrane protein n=1 Tax=Neohortaea acidophila TaxID=245834 RepID=A0A6A6PXZ5_9PEZI|nr:uncharacterized protein BDY17DRAFT_132547 [Neohortaea acidophila]KAF2484636.1 hypothetical protein BDY17DRAFT_132547 [Neohortaea acidophila]
MQVLIWLGLVGWLCGSDMLLFYREGRGGEACLSRGERRRRSKKLAAKFHIPFGFSSFSNCFFVVCSYRDSRTIHVGGTWTLLKRPARPTVASRRARKSYNNDSADGGSDDSSLERDGWNGAGQGNAGCELESESTSTHGKEKERNTTSLAWRALILSAGELLFFFSFFLFTFFLFAFALVRREMMPAGSWLLCSLARAWLFTYLL